MPRQLRYKRLEFFVSLSVHVKVKKFLKIHSILTVKALRFTRSGETPKKKKAL